MNGNSGMQFEGIGRKYRILEGGKPTNCSQNGRISICTGCKEPIEDRFVMKVVDEPWHETCLQCCVCRAPLSRSCFSKDRKLYCRNDYEKVFGTKCSGCNKIVPASELVMRALGNVYHLQCFVCALCGHRLEKGQEFALKDNKLYCKEDFEKLSSNPKLNNRSHEKSTEKNHKQEKGEKIITKVEENDTDDSDDDDDDENKKGPKRPRTILTSSQRKVFKSSFEISSKPCRKVREELSRETGLSVRVVQVWFQNQRAKIKKLARRNNPDSDGAASCRVSNRQSRSKKSKDEKNSSTREKNRIDRDGMTLSSPSLPVSQPPPYGPMPGMLTPSQFQGHMTGHMGPLVSYQTPYSHGQPQLNHMETGDIAMDHQMQNLDECMMSQQQYHSSPEMNTIAVTAQNGQNHLELMHDMINSF